MGGYGGFCRWCAPSPRLICTPSPLLLLLLLVFDVHPRLLLLLLLLPTAPTGPIILQNSVRYRGDIAAQFEACRCRLQHTVHIATHCTVHSVHIAALCAKLQRGDMQGGSLTS